MLFFVRRLRTAQSLCFDSHILLWFASGWQVTRHIAWIQVYNLARISMPPNPNAVATIGFRAHSGWAALIAIAGPLDAPRVLDRRRIELCDPHDPRAKQPYHAAEPLGFREAQELVNRCIASSQKLALRAVQSIISDLEQQGHQLAAAAILCASGRSLPDLKAVLASHALIHAAEGEMFRDVLVRASTECGLSVTKVKERELWSQSESSTGLSERKLQQHLVALGKELGPPWRHDEKYATLAAWMTLANTAHTPTTRASHD
jgi:hypothetical protein